MVEAYERLIAAGANPDAVDRGGQTPETRAVVQDGRIAAAIAQKQHEAGTPLAPGVARRVARSGEFWIAQTKKQRTQLIQAF